MQPVVRRIVTAGLLIAGLRGEVVATPVAPQNVPHDRDAAARASSGASPWIDESPAQVLAGSDPQAGDHKLASALILGGLYAGFIGWTYFAWYRGEDHEFRIGGDHEPDQAWYTWFGSHTYAAGADKLGHAWATLGLARGGTELLHQYGGYSKLKSALVATALSEALFLGVEIKDGYSYTFSVGDFLFNTLGAGLALASSLSPRVDELVDFRVEWLPSPAYRRLAKDGNVDIAEDYSGQRYLLALHLGALPGLRDARWARWSRFVDVAVGFESRGYKPDPPYKVTEEMPDYDKSSQLFLGVSLNAQGLFDALLRRGSGLRKLTHGIFEVYNLPGTSGAVFGTTRTPVGAVPNDGA